MFHLSHDDNLGSMIRRQFAARASATIVMYSPLPTYQNSTDAMGILYVSHTYLPPLQNNPDRYMWANYKSVINMF